MDVDSRTIWQEQVLTHDPYEFLVTYSYKKFDGYLCSISETLDISYIIHMGITTTR